MDKYTKKILENQDKYVIFYSEWCGYSKKAIAYLEEKGVPFKGYIIDKIKGNLKELTDNLKKTISLTNFDISHITRPIIFKNGSFLGGYSELVKDI